MEKNKFTKKLLSVILAASLTVGTTVPVFAAESKSISVSARYAEAVSAPKCNLKSATYTASKKTVTFSTDDDSVIYYTTDGKTPTKLSKKYTGSFAVTKTTTVKAIAINGGVKSDVKTIKITLKSSKPTANIKSATYNTVKSMQLKTSTTNADIYYTTDGSTPTKNSTLYTGVVKLDKNTTVKAIAVKSGFSNSSVLTINYKIRAALPTASIASGTYTSAQNITLTSSVSGAKIYYTTNGKTPTAKSTLYSSPISVSSDTTIKAIVVSDQYANSKTATFTYKIGGKTPTASITGGTYTQTQSVKLTAGQGDEIRYTTSGSDPTATSAIYSSSINISKNTTLKAAVFKDGKIASPVMTEKYSIKTKAPKASKAAGSYTSLFTTTLSADSGAVIYYTTDGSTPTTSSKKYTSALEISKTVTLKIIACIDGMTSSDVVTYEYTFKVPTPTSDTKSGSITDDTIIYLACSDYDAAIYYTTDGKDPTTKSTLYNDWHGILISGSTTVKAIAVKSGVTNSDVATFTYRMGCYKPEGDIKAGTYYDAMYLYLSTITDGAVIYYTTDGSTPTTASRRFTDMGIEITRTMTIKAIAVKSGLEASDVYSGTFTITAAPPTVNLAAGKTYEGTQYVDLNTNTSNGTIYYTTNGSVPTRTALNTYTGTIVVDKTMVITAITYATGMTTSAPVTFRYTIKNAKPTASTASGSVVAPNSSISLNYDTTGTLYYTTNGSTPTTYASATTFKYTGPITITANTTIKAIVIKTGCTNSDAATFTYTVGEVPATPVFDVASGEIAGGTMVSLSTATAGATIRYTTDGTNPTATTGTLYSAPIAVNTAVTIKAVAVKSGIASSVSTASYAIQAIVAEKPSISYNSTDETISITSSQAGAVIYYTTDGSEPTTASAVYSAPIDASIPPMTVKAIAIYQGATSVMADFTLS